MAGVWSMGGQGLDQLIRLGSNLVMTRLLVPDMFGIMAIANILLVGLSLLTDIGLTPNIVRSTKGSDPNFLNAVWSIKILQGIVIWFLSIIFSATLYFANLLNLLDENTVYSNPILPFLIIVLCLSMMISGFESTRTMSAVRDFDQKSLVKLSLFSQFTGVITMLIWSYFDRSVWVLVSGQIASSVTRTILSHKMYADFVNHWLWNIEVVKEILHFGKWVLLSTIISFMFFSGDRLILASFVTPEVLGVYSIAFLLLNAFQTIFFKLNSAVVFPAISEAIREKSTSVKHAYYRYRLFLDTLILFVMGFLFVTADLIINFLYDSRYSNAGFILSILSLSLFAQRYNMVEQYFLAIGQPKLMTTIKTIRMVALYLFIPSGFHLYGFEGALFGIVLSYYFSLPYTFYLKVKFKMLDLKKEVLLLPVILAGGISGELLKLIFLKF